MRRRQGRLSAGSRWKWSILHTVGTAGARARLAARFVQLERRIAGRGRPEAEIVVYRFRRSREVSAVGRWAGGWQQFRCRCSRVDRWGPTGGARFPRDRDVTLFHNDLRVD